MGYWSVRITGSLLGICWLTYICKWYTIRVINDRESWTLNMAYKDIPVPPAGTPNIRVDYIVRTRIIGGHKKFKSHRLWTRTFKLNEHYVWDPFHNVNGNSTNDEEEDDTHRNTCALDACSRFLFQIRFFFSTQSIDR